MELQFMGAVGTVTGSMHLLHANGEKLLVDCGLYQGHRKEAEKKNRHLPFPADSIVNMILTHAHIDHSGHIPNLVKSGFEGNIFSTFATRDLCAVMLRDSAHIQEKDAEYLNKKLKKRGLPPIEPIYSMEDARNSLEYFVAWGYNRKFFINSAVQAQFVDAGHILGSAQAIVDVEENGKSAASSFRGIWGEKNCPFSKIRFRWRKPITW
jgi:metallo-beta-lactamase family protein